MTKAREGWNKSREGRWEVTDAAYEHIAEGLPAETFNEVEQLDPPMSRASVYRYARAGKAYWALHEIYGDSVSRIRLVLFETYFEAVAHLIPSEAYEWLMEAYMAQPRPTIEDFRKLVPADERENSDIAKTARDIERIIKRPQFGGDNKLWQIVNKLLRKAIELLQREAASGLGGGAGDN